MLVFSAVLRVICEIPCPLPLPTLLSVYKNALFEVQIDLNSVCGFVAVFFFQLLPNMMYESLKDVFSGCLFADFLFVTRLSMYKRMLEEKAETVLGVRTHSRKLFSSLRNTKRLLLCHAALLFESYILCLWNIIVVMGHHFEELERDTF